MQKFTFRIYDMNFLLYFDKFVWENIVKYATSLIVIQGESSLNNLLRSMCVVLKSTETSYIQLRFFIGTPLNILKNVISSAYITIKSLLRAIGHSSVIIFSHVYLGYLARLHFRTATGTVMIKFPSRIFERLNRLNNDVHTIVIIQYAKISFSIIPFRPFNFCPILVVICA